MRLDGLFFRLYSAYFINAILRMQNPFVLQRAETTKAVEKAVAEK